MATKTKTKKKSVTEKIKRAAALRAPAKKRLTKAQKLQREIARRNRLYAKATAAEKRVLIAKDVIAQIKARRFVAEPGTWTAAFAPQSLKIQDDASFQKTFLDNPQLECSCCAVGSLFLGCTLYANKVPFGEIHNNRTLGDTLFFRESKIANGFDKLFSNAQLGLIETAFEGTTGFFDSDYGNNAGDKVTDAQVTAAYAYGDTYVEPEDRLVAIMENIIKNKGTFKP